MRHQVRRSERGFTLIELIIILAILATAAFMILPRLFWFVDRAKLRGAALATKTMIQQARLAALKGTGGGRVVFDYPNGRIYAFVDSNGNGTYDAGTDRQLGDYRLREVGKKTVIAFMSHNDTGPNTAGAIESFDDPPFGGTCGGNGCIVFDQNGTGQTGAVRFTDGYGNFLEVRILSTATGRTEVRKYSRAKNLYVPEGNRSGGANGSRSLWDWYEDRDTRVPLL